MTEEKKIEQPKLQFLTCSKCQGKGILDKKICHECQGLGIMAWTGNILLYWSKKISFLQIAQDKLKELVRKLINLSLALFGIFGLLMLAWSVYIVIVVKLPLSQIIYFRTWQLFVFWLSMLTNFYLWYRFQREIEKNNNFRN